MNEVSERLLRNVSDKCGLHIAKSVKGFWFVFATVLLRDDGLELFRAAPAVARTLDVDSDAVFAAVPDQDKFFVDRTSYLKEFKLT